ncbi:Transglutaminase elicitor [Phytophthora cactorum]|nr:Transglutaminase elicitor [Phytophthora cactorum]
MVYSPAPTSSPPRGCGGLPDSASDCRILLLRGVLRVDTDGKISNDSPLVGTEISDQDCAIEVEVDPTLPDITTISTVPVTYPDLLANLTTAPSEPVFSKVGTVIMSEETPATDADQDAYIDSTLPWIGTGTPTKTGVEKTAKDCATGWEETAAGDKLQEKLEKKRRLEENTNRDIARLEAYFGTKMEMTLKDLPTQGVHTPSPGLDQASPLRSTPRLRSGREDFMDKVSKDKVLTPRANADSARLTRDASPLTTPANLGLLHPDVVRDLPRLGPGCHSRGEPTCPVTHNGVTFQPIDIKGLISDVYDGAGVATCRHTNAAYRDLNPAYFHIASANILGKLNAHLLLTSTRRRSVEPARAGFKVFEQTAMSLEEAAQTFYGLEEYPWNAAAKSIRTRTVAWWPREINRYTTGKYYYYLLELDDAGEIIGGEWVYDSDSDHPDFLWVPKAKPAATVTSIGLSYADVSMLLEKSVACSDSTSAAGSVSSGSV